MWPDSETYTQAIAACAKAGEWQRALLMLEEMVKKVRAGTVILSWRGGFVTPRRAGLGVGERGGVCAPNAYNLPHQPYPPLQSVAPTTATYNAAMRACQRGGQGERALAFFEEMVRCVRNR